MKLLKLLPVLAMILVSGSLRAGVTSGSITVDGDGTALLVIVGSNGYYYADEDGVGNIGALSEPSDVLNPTQVVLRSSAGASSTITSQCYLTLPTGATATVEATVAQAYDSSTGNYSGTAFAYVGGSTYSAYYSNSGTTYTKTLTAGTYLLKAYTVAGSVESPSVLIVANISYE